MKKYSQWSIFGIAFIMLLVLTTACGFGGAQTAIPTPTPTPKPKTPIQVLKESQAKMDTLQSVTIDGTGTSKTSSTDSGDTDSQMKFSGGALKSPLSLSLQMDITVTTRGTTIPLSLAMISVDQKIYIQNTKKPAIWYIMTDEQGKDFFGSLGSPDKTKSNLLNVATDSDVTDHGTDTLNGKKLRHLTITVSNDKKELKRAFLADAGEDFKNLTPEQLDAIVLQNGTTDYWIDETTMYVYQQTQQYKTQYHVDESGAITLGSYNLTKEESTTQTFSKFDEPVTIKAPENAQPLNSILDLFA